MAEGAGLSACPACGGALTAWRTVPGGEPSDPKRYELLRCGSCGSAVTRGPSPDPDAYETGQYALTTPRMRAPISTLQRLATRQPRRYLERAGLEPGARVLDVGAGPGRLVETLTHAGYDAAGIDASRRSVAIAHQAGRAVTRRDLFEHTDADLDAAVLWHVLEHLDDPAAALATVRGWLRPGGLLLVGVPNLASVQAEIGGDGWLHFDAPRHRLHFTADGVHRLLMRSGFDVLHTHHFVVEHNIHGMWFSLLTRLGMRPGFPFHYLKRNVDARPRDLALTVLGIPLIPVAALMEGGAALVHRGGTIAVVARAS